MNSFDFIQCEDVYPETDWDWTDWDEECDEDGY